MEKPYYPCGTQIKIFQMGGLFDNDYSIEEEINLFLTQHEGFILDIQAVPCGNLTKIIIIYRV